MLAGKQHPDLGMLCFRLEPLDFLLQVLENILPLCRQLQQRAQISALAREPVIQIYVLLEAMPFLECRLSFLHAIPEARLGDLLFSFWRPVRLRAPSKITSYLPYFFLDGRHSFAQFV